MPNEVSLDNGLMPQSCLSCAGDNHDHAAARQREMERAFVEANRPLDNPPPPMPNFPTWAEFAAATFVDDVKYFVATATRAVQLAENTGIEGGVVPAGTWVAELKKPDGSPFYLTLPDEIMHCIFKASAGRMHALEVENRQMREQITLERSRTNAARNEFVQASRLFEQRQAELERAHAIQRNLAQELEEYRPVIKALAALDSSMAKVLGRS